MNTLEIALARLAREKKAARLRALAADLDEQGDHDDAKKCRDDADLIECE